MFRSASVSVRWCAAVLVAGAASNSVTASETIVTEYNAPVFQVSGYYGYGRDASPEEIAGWDIDIRPDGLGLPDGSGTPEEGELLYENQCASCHGSFGEGVGRYPVLAGGEGTLTEPRPEKTVGSFWPYASTLWDYIHRAMPYAAPESLTDEEVYAITAYVLYLNDLIEYDFELTKNNVAAIEMPNKDGFFVDNRPDVVNELCMRNCKDPGSVKITSEPELAEATQDFDETVTVRPSLTGEEIYQQACALCHATGLGGAPITGDRSDWSARLAQGRAALIASALSGKGAMPPQSGQSGFSDDEVAAAVDFMMLQTTSKD